LSSLTRQAIAGGGNEQKKRMAATNDKDMTVGTAAFIFIPPTPTPHTKNSS